MKRKFFATLALFVLVLAGAFSPVFGFLITARNTSIAYAQTFSGETPGSSGTDTAPVYQGPGGAPDGTGAETDPNAATATEQQQPPKELECGLNVLCAFVVGYTYYVNFLPNLLTQVSGMVLDYVVWKNLQSETYTSQDDVDSLVVRGWKLTRDFSNLLFIFALFVVAFSLILSSAGTDTQPLFGLDPKRTIARIILMALLINFSFFMCRVIIDVTNLFGNVFYNKITLIESDSAQNSQQTLSSGSGGNVQNEFGTSKEFYSATNFAGIRSVSLGILSKINPQGLMYKTAGGRVFEDDGEEHSVLGFGWKEYDGSVYILLLFVSTLVGFFNFFLIYLFISSSIFLFARIYGLFFLIILSPIAFVSTTIPAFQKKEWFGFDDWFKQLVGLAFSMPIYLFFLWLAIFFFDIGTTNAQFTGYISVAVVIIIKLVAMGFVLIFGKKVAKDLSGKIGAMAVGAVTSVVTGTAMIAGAAMTGGASAALRMGGQLAKNKAQDLGASVIGQERVDQLRQRLSGLNFKSLGSFNSDKFAENSLKFFKGVTMPGSDVADKTMAAFRQGRNTPRMEDMKRSAEAVEKAKAAKDAADKEKTRAVDKKIADLKAEKDAGAITSKEYEDKLKALVQEKRDILDPTSKQKNVANQASAELEKAKREQASGNYDEKMKQGDQKLADLNTKLKDSVDSVTAASAKLAQVENDEAKAKQEVLDKQQAISATQDTHNEKIRDLGTQRQNAIAQGKTVEDDLAKLDKEIAMTPKIGFGADQQKLTQMREAREALLQQKKEAADKVASTDNEIRTTTTNHSSTLAALNQERDAAVAKQNAAAAAKQQATTSLTTAETAKQEVEKGITETQAANNKIANDKQAMEAKVAELAERHESAKGLLNFKQETLRVQEEIDSRTRVDKRDLTNRRRNEERVNKLKDYLTNISNGGPLNPKV